MKEEEVRINFNEEPNKSQKQILKLVAVFERHVQTRSEYIKQLKSSSAEEEDEISIPEVEASEFKSIFAGECEERAMLLFQAFNKKTSIIYDVQSLCELLKKDSLKESTQQVIAHLTHLALKYAQFYKA